MDFSNFSHDGEHGFLTEQKESHWQPALRPNEAEIDQSQQQPEAAMSSQKQSYSPVEDDDDYPSEEQHSRSRLDPAWGIKRADSAHILDTVHRSPSFPAPESQQAIPSARLVRQSDVLKSSTVAELAYSHSVSQVEPDAENEYEPEILHNAHDAEILRQQEEPSFIEQERDQVASRYEEGMPLITAEQEQEPEQYAAPEPEPQPGQSSAIPDFKADKGDAADGFFSQVKDESQLTAETKPWMERKETVDVLDGLGVQNTAPDSPPPPIEETPEESSQQESAEEKDFAAAFGDDFTEDKDLAAAFAKNQDPEEDPWKAIIEDDEDFLIDDADDLLPDSDEEVDSAPAPLPTRPAQLAASTQRAPTYATSRSSFAPHQPTTSELTGFAPTMQNVGLPRQLQNSMNAYQPTQERPNITSRAESFVDQSKGGYKSPYDLPMDLAPKKRVQAQRPAPPVNTVPPPPPRTSSMNAEKHLQSPFTPSAPNFNQSAVVSPPAPPPKPPVDRSGSVPVQPAQTTSKRAASGFFEELPVAPRAKPAASRAATAQTPAGPPRQPSMSNTAIVASPPQIQQRPPPQQQDPYAQFQLQQPPKLDPYANVPLQTAQPAQASLAPAPPAAPARYSPAPPGLQNGIRTSPSPRYSPAPPAQATGPRYSPAPPPQANGQNRYVSQPANLPFQPRTSSPLAQHRRSVDDSAGQTQQSRPNLQHSATASLPYNPLTNSLSPPRAFDPVKQEIVPPQRSQTQSPSRQMARSGVPPRIAPPPNRPASAFGQLSPTRTQPPQNVFSPPRIVAQRPPAEELDYVRPADGTEHDPLQRFKGSPIFKFGFGGTVVTSFPVRTPRFSTTAARPQIKASSGDVKTRKFDSILAPTEQVSKFPGPLKGKAKKKDVLTWLSTAVGSLQNEMMSNPSKRLEEKLNLWKIVQVLVESDGNLESPQAVQKASAVLMPEVYALDEPTATPYPTDDMSSGIYRPESFTAKSEAVDPVAVEKLRKTLLKGKREDAVWQAVDNRLWSHALLLASTLDKSVWKSVVAEFVKQEVKTMGSNADSLCALYEVLGGNTEESVDQLVPPSARAGLQMVSRVEASGPTRNALDGLDRWKETLCLILNNRSVDDQRAVITLARLLTDYGRIEAAHTCYLFAKNLVFGGADDPSTMVVLVGADQRNHPTSFHLDTESIMLTEVYEFAMSTLALGASGLQMPHLAAYKLQRAKELADAGMKTEAQAYCDALEAALKSSTKNSLHYNRTYQAELQDLSNRVRQIPIQSASWAKPSIEKVSGSLLNKFSNFITGEDSDADSKGSARDAAEAGPFAKVSGSPTLSRNTSQTDLYGSYPAAMQTTPAPAPTAAGSRYAPNGMSSARSSSELARGRASFEHQRSPPTSSHGNEPPRSIYAPAMQSQQNAYSPNMMSPPATGYQANLYQPSPEQPMPSVAEESYPPSHATSYAPQPDIYTPQASQPETNGIMSPPVAPAFGGYTPDLAQQPQFTPAPTEPTPSSTFEPPSSSFEPPTDTTGYGGYAPPEDPGYQPYVPEPESPEDQRVKPKKKSFMDDDDDFPRPANTTAPAQASTDDAARKKANDEAAEAAFRAAAEADAARAKEQASKKTGSGSWGFGLGGLFSAKKPDSLDAGSSKSSAADKKVHRVHLGESKMKLYYDKEKGKWINPDNPEASEKKATPPPPRSSSGSVPPMGGPPRSVSQPAPPAPLSRSGTPMSQAVDTGSEGGDSRPGTGSGIPPAGSGIAATLPPGTAQSLGLGHGAGSSGTATPPGTSSGLTPPGAGPPPRPASALSNASGLDDLLGGPPTAGRRGGRTTSGARGKKGRYVDVMAK